MAEPLIGTVRGRYLVTEGDVSRPAKGRVTFTPLQPEGTVDVAASTRYARGVVVGVFDAAGWVHRDGDTLTYLRLPVGLWSVELAAPGLAPTAFLIEASATAEANLPALQPLTPAPYEKFVVNEDVYNKTLLARAGAEAARDVALAGQFLGAVVPSSGVDLNTLTTAGVWRFSAAAAAASTNAPSAGAAVCVVHPVANDLIEQRFTPSWSPFRGEFVRAGSTSSGFGPWRFLSAQRTDAAAGLAVYAGTESGGEQLVYGDTGWRDLTSSILNGATATWIRIRRVGYAVHLVFQNVAPPGTASVDFLNVPTGFAPTGHPFTYFPTRPSGSTALQNILLKPGSPTVVALSLAGYASGHGGIAYALSWTTTDAWPAALPGSAFGGIPTS